jgi:hypothetical protein
MHRAASLIFAGSVFLVSAVAVAQVQPGSTGGTIGKQNKSVSGEDQSPPPAQRAKRPVRASDRNKKISTDNDGIGGQKVYANPTLNGTRIDWCSSEGLRGCGKPAADAWCRSKGLAHSKSFAWEYHSPVIRIASRTKCDGFCGAFTEVVCE